MKNKTFEVRDFRNKQFFMVDDAYLNGYAKLCGSNATLVYLCLCRHADKHQQSFPSVLLMAEKTGLSKNSIMRGIQKLIEFRIVSKERSRRDDAKWLNNTYTLLDKTTWKSKPSPTQPLGCQVPNESKAKSQNRQSHIPQGDTKETHYKDTHKKDTHIDLFLPLWKKYPKKDGKKAALKHFNATVKTKEDFCRIAKALKNYVLYIQTEGIKERFIKNGSTWFNNWEDWVDRDQENEGGCLNDM